MSLISNTTQVDFILLPDQTGGNLGTAATTVDICSNIRINQTSGTLLAPIGIGLFSPTDTTTTQYLTLSNIGTGFFAIAAKVVNPGTSISLVFAGVWQLESETTIIPTANIIETASAAFSAPDVDTNIILNAPTAQTLTILAPTSNKRLYTIVSNGPIDKILSQSYTRFDGVTTTVIPAHATITIQSVGALWKQIYGAASRIDLPGTLTLRSNTISNAAATLNITAAQVDANSTIKIIQTGSDATLSIAAPVTSTAAGRMLRIHNDVASSRFITFNGTIIYFGRFLDFQWGGISWSIPTNQLSGNIVAMASYNSGPETVVPFDGLEMKWHNSSATSYDGIAIRSAVGSKILRYSTIEIYQTSAAIDNGKALWGSSNAWYNLPMPTLTANIVNATFPHAQTVGTTFLGIGNPGLPAADYRQFMLYNDTDNVAYKITIDKLATTGEVLAPQNGFCAIIVEKLGTTTNQIITAGPGIAIANGVISNTGGTTTRAMVRASSASGVASASGAIITFATEELDTTNSFNPTTGTFTAPRTGQYRISCQFLAGSSNAIIGSRFGVFLSTNGLTFGAGSPLFSYFVSTLNPSNVAFGGSYIKTLAAGNTLTFRALIDSATSMTLSGNANFDFITIEEINNFY